MRTFILLVLVALCSVSFAQTLDWTTLHPPALGHAISATYFDVGPRPVRHVVYLTDGGKWASETSIAARLRKLHAQHPDYSATRYVLIGTIDSAANVDHRQHLFGCDNDELHEAFAKTLIPWAEDSTGRAFNSSDRTLIGLSLGGAHAATELTRDDALFGNFVLLSPITYACPDLARRVAFLSAAFERSEEACPELVERAKTRRAYLSTGRLDAETYAEPLDALLRGAGVETEFVQTEGDHDFANWDAQWDSVLAWLHGAGL